MEKMVERWERGEWSEEEKKSSEGEEEEEVKGELNSLLWQVFLHSFALLILWCRSRFCHSLLSKGAI